MAQAKVYRCWYRDGSARLVNQTSHRDAAAEAQELAGLENAPAPAITDKAETRRYLDACKVARTECLTDGTETKWK